MADETNTPAGVPDLSAKEVAEAQKQGAKDYIADGTAAAMAADTGTSADMADVAEAQAKRMRPDLNTTFLAHYLDLGIDAFKDALDPKADPMIADDEVKGILALERNGPNRTPYVHALCKRLGVKSPYEVYHGGPGYTNDVSSVTAL